MKKFFLLIITSILFGSLGFANELYEKLDKNIYPNSIYHWIPKNCINVLKTQNRNNLKQYYPDIEKLSYYDEAEDKIFKWYEANCYINILIEQRLINGYDVLEIGYETLGAGWKLSFAVEEKDYIDGVWYLSCIEAEYTKSTKNTNCFTRWPVENDELELV